MDPNDSKLDSKFTRYLMELLTSALLMDTIRGSTEAKLYLAFVAVIVLLIVMSQVDDWHAQPAAPPPPSPSFARRAAAKFMSRTSSFLSNS